MAVARHRKFSARGLLLAVFIVTICIFGNEKHREKQEYTYVFSHIPKAAGSSFEKFLMNSNNTGLKFCGPRKTFFRWGGEVEAALKARIPERDCQIISSEINYYTITSISHIHSVRIMTFFRDPLTLWTSRVDNSYRANRKYDGKISPASYLEQRLSEDANVGSIYLHWLTGEVIGKGFANRTGGLQLALDLLDNTWFIGVVEYYDISICLFTFQIGKYDHQRCSCHGNESHGHQKKKENVLKSQVEYRQPHLQRVSVTIHPLDKVIYSAVLKVFFKRLLQAERDSGHMMICDSTARETALELRNA